MSTFEADMKCRDFVIRCIRALDGRDYETMAGSFREDGVWERAGEELVGSKAVRDALEKRPADLETQHLVSNMVVDFESDTVVKVQYTLAAYAQRKGVPYHLHAIFKAEDRVVQTADGWRFLRRAVEPAFSNQG